MADIQQNRKLRIGDVLKELDYINDDELEEALAYQREHRGVRLGQTLIDLGYITEDQLLDALSKRLDVPLVDIGAVDVDIDAVRLVPENIAQETSTLPIAATDSTITIVTDDPLNFYGIEEIRQLTGRSVEVKLAKHTPIVRAQQYYYAEVSPFMEAEDASLDFNSLSDLAQIDVTADASDAPPSSTCSTA